VSETNYSDEQLTRFIRAYDPKARDEDIAESIRIWRSGQAGSDTPAPRLDELCVCGHKRGEHWHRGTVQECGTCDCRVFAQTPRASGEKHSLTNPPICPKHKEVMLLSFWDRPGSAPGNGWSCASCARERDAAQTTPPPSEGRE
jgi:hypothetical protein